MIPEITLITEIGRDCSNMDGMDIAVWVGRVGGGKGAHRLIS